MRITTVALPVALALCAGAVAFVSPLDAHAAKKSKKKKGAKEAALSNACDEDDGAACGELAEMLLGKEDINDKSARRAVALLERGCELKDGPSCARLAKELVGAVWLKQDNARAADLAQKGCSLGEVPACVQLGTQRLNGSGVEQSFKEAVPLFKHACKEEVAEGCLYLGVMMQEGKGGPPDPSRAEGYFEKGCDMESGESCFRLAELHYNGKAPPAAGEPAGSPNFKKAARYYTAGCDLDFANACTALGKMRRAGQGMGMDEDVADELLEKACSLGDEWACVESNAAPTDGTVLEAIRQKCEDKNNMNACFALGAAYLKSDEEKKWEQGAGMLQESCDKGVTRSCYKLAVVLEKGEPIPKDIKRSQNLFERACKGGIKKACNR